MKRDWIFYLGIFVVGIGAGHLLGTAKIADLNTFQKRDLANIGPFDYQYSYYQSFVSESPDLCLIEFPLVSAGYPKRYNFYVSIQLTDAEGNEIASKQYRILRSAQADTVRFSFPPQTDSFQKKYRLLLRTDAPPNLVSLWGSEYDSYPGGELVSNQLTINPQDLAFFTYSKLNILTLIQQTVRNSGGRMKDLVLITIIFWGLGYIITFFFLPDQTPLERVLHSLLTGMALPPALFFTLGLLKIKFAEHLAQVAILILISSAILALWTVRNNNWRLTPALFQRSEIIALSLLFILALATRTIQLDALIVPSGIDSQFHSNAVERIRQGKEITLDSIYHLGFHSDAVLVNELTKDSIPESILLYGQWLSVVAGLSFYLLSREFFGNWIYAMVATSFYWFISPIPAYLTSIARYPFLQGITLLPWAITLIWNHRRHQSSNEVVVLIAVTGLFLSHYGSMAILLIVITGVMLLELVHRKLPSFKTVHTARILGTSAIVILIILIKFYYIVAQGSWNSFLVSRSTALTLDDYQDIFNHILRHGGILLWALGMVGGILYFAHHKKQFPMVFLCLGGLLGSDWLQMNLLGHSVTRPINTLFALAIPLSLFAGVSLEYFFRNRESAAVAAIFILALAGAYNIVGIVNPRNVFYTRADQIAMDWINSHVPEKSVILINSYPWDQSSSPADGGYWIPDRTGRQTVFANTHEEYDQIERFIVQTNADFVYIGTGYGNITPMLMDELDEELVYDRDGIYIYKIHHSNP